MLLFVLIFKGEKPFKMVDSDLVVDIDMASKGCSAVGTDFFHQGQSVMGWVVVELFSHPPFGGNAAG